MPDAAGLVIAGDHEDARAYAALLRGKTGKRPVVVLSDDPTASKKISAFANSEDRWMVAVRMVSEGVDIPRLAVGVYATSVSTALFFAQAVGRFVRVRRRGETASVFLPSVPVLLSYAAELEAERDHILRYRIGEAPEEEELEQAQRQRDTPDTFDEPAFQALTASAHFDRVLYDGGEFGTATAAGSPEEEDFLGLPGLLEPDQVRTLLRQRQNAQLTTRSRTASSSTAASSRAAESTAASSRAAESTAAAKSAVSPIAPVAPGASAVSAAQAATAPPVSRQALAALRKELNGLVGAWSHRTGQPHGVIHAELRRTCGGPQLPQATADQIQARIDMLRRWAVSGR
jgi:superfamily II DNA or RNA helicase